MPYHVHISQFDGPLDLLLHLIESAEIDIKDIFVSEITTQYLSYMNELESLDMDVASEFLALAATLVYIKSRQLLPRPPRELQEPEEDPETLLIRQLREYKLFKQAGELLHNLKEQASGAYARLPEDVVLPEQEIILGEATADELYRHFYALLHAKPAQIPIHPLHQVVKDRFTVRQQIAKIRGLLQSGDDIEFESIFDQNATRLEILTTFMALLEMASRGEAYIRQSAPFASIRLKAGVFLEGDDDENYMDEIME